LDASEAHAALPAPDEPVSADALPPEPAPRLEVKRKVRLGSGVLAGLFTLAVVYTLYFAKALFIPIALALLLNLLLAPIVRGLRKHLHLPEGLGAALVLILLLSTVAVSFYGLSGPATRWLAELPVAMAEVETKIETLRRPVQEVQEAAQKVAELAQTEDAQGQQPVTVAVQGPSLTQMFVGGAMTIVAGLVIMIALLFFLLASGDTLLRQAVSIAPRLRDKKRVVEIMRDTEDDISYYLLTISIINVGLGCAVGLAMYLIGMPNAILWGVMAAILNFVPFLGAVVGIGIVGLVALLAFETPGLIVLPPLVYLALTSLEAQFVTPALLARRLTLNPVAVFLALILWTWLWGIPGALMAIPLLAVFKICCDHIEPLNPVGTMLGR
jgi:predicted PurR-regulated permease PerM